MQSLWIDLEEGRYYLIPAEAMLPGGETLLITLNGEERLVERSAVEVWEVPGIEAQLHLQSAALRLLLQAGAGGGGEEIPAGAEPADETEETFPREARRLFAVLFGLPGGGGAATAHLRLPRVLLRLAHILEESIAEDEERRAEAHREMETLVEEFVAQGIALPGELRDLPAKVRRFYLMFEDRTPFEEFSRLLRVLAAQSWTEPTNLQELRALLQRVGRETRAFYEAEREAERRAEYRAMAREAIREVQGDEPPAFDFKQVWAEYHAEKLEKEDGEPR
ncbi:MAG: hypothetical protein ACLFU8_08215 [Anaerolineales bacterium]